MEEEQLRNLEMRKKIREQRKNVVTELLVTEREYYRDLKLTSQVFRLNDPDYLATRGIDSATLFGNILEVIELSRKFIDQLDECDAEESANEADSIGNCFIRSEPDFRRVYGTYCTNHDDAQNLLEKYESNPLVSQVLEEGVQTLRQEIVCFNMGSVIIKPVQRILKYPLILNELIKHTENDHLDRCRLTKAATLMTDVASYINESKRKKEIVLKYRNSGVEDKLSHRISRISMHSVAKKSSRLGMLLKTSLGITPATRDSAFDEEEARFSELVRVVQTALRDITSVCEQLKATAQTQFNISEAVAAFYGEGSRVPVIDNFRTAQRMIFTQHWSAFDAYVIQHVRNPLTALCEACQGPERLVQKRRDKLLDANIASERLSKNKDPSLKRSLEEEQNLARNTYVALNSQLLEELPFVTAHGYSIYRRCLSSFLHARKLLVGRTTKELLDLNEMPEIANLQGSVEEDFVASNSQAVERFSTVSFITKSFRCSRVSGAEGSPSTTPPRKTSLSKGNHSPGEGLVIQSRETINLLRSKYGPDQLFMVTGRCEIKEPLDIAANSGLIVGVIKREDPMGNSSRWFVDAGEIRGFLPVKHLGPIPQSTGRLLRPESAVSMASSGGASVSEASNSIESFKEAQLLGDDQAGNNAANAAGNTSACLYDLPPSYEEAQGLVSPHRYCEIDDLADISADMEKGASNCELNATAESPIYVEIEDLSSEPKLRATNSSNNNNVYKVEYTFKKSSPIEIDLVDGEFVTVLSKHDEAGNPEWWLIENNQAVQGYAPASYLSQLLTDDSPVLFS